MSANPAETYLNHPRYQMALHHLQKGEWRAGVAHVEHLMVQYPLVPELRALRQDFLLRAKFDEDERVDRALEKSRRLKTLVTRVGVTIVTLALLFVGIRTYSAWLGKQFNLARERLEYEIQMAQLYAKSRDAQTLLSVGRSGEAKVLLDEIARINPDFPGLQASLALAEVESQFEKEYAEAMQLIEREDWTAAQAILANIATQDPNYRDISLQLADTEKQILLSDIFTQAELDFQNKAWEAAVAGYEGMRALHPEYKASMIEDRLFNSYVNAARSELIDQADSLNALETAEEYFRKALALRPQNAEIKTERELARLYLQAQEDFKVGLWSDVISALELVYVNDPEYAQGTARQTLYDAYVARGDKEMANAHYTAAMNDFQRSITLAEHDPEAALRLYEARLKAAEALGLQGSYEGAVIHYREATEVGGLKTRSYQDNPALAALIQDAEYQASKGNFGMAYERYRQAMNMADETQETVVHVVQEGEYLTLLASHYGSTVRAIALANGIANSNLIYVGQELLIPVLP